jgi:hypothetical protein
LRFSSGEFIRFWIADGTIPWPPRNSLQQFLFDAALASTLLAWAVSSYLIGSHPVIPGCGRAGAWDAACRQAAESAQADFAIF